MRLLAAMLISQAARRCPLPLCSSSSSSSLKLEPWLAPHEPVDDDVGCVVSHFEAIALHSDLRSRLPPPSAEAVAVDLSGSGSDLTVDLGLKRVVGASITATEIRIDLADGSACDMPWAWLARVAKKQRSGVWEVYRAGVDEAPAKIEGLSELTRRPASLMPLPGAVPPTAVLGGFNMHRVKGLSPAEDTERKLSALGPGARGRVLDVCTGLGYTAIGAARKPAVEEVVTIELDPQMVALQRANPWSAELFDSPTITRLRGDATEVLPTLPDGAFSACIHDPPANALSGELYSLAFYLELHRVLKSGGTLYHYIGDPSSKASGKLFRGVADRLRKAGFAAPKTSERAFGITAVAKQISR